MEKLYGSETLRLARQPLGGRIWLRCAAAPEACTLLGFRWDGAIAADLWACARRIHALRTSRYSERR